MAVGDIYRISFVGAEGADVRVTTMHMKALQAGSDLDTLCADLKAGFVDLIKTKQAAAFSWTAINTYKLAVPSTITEYTTGFPVVGTQTYQGPPQVAVTVTTRTGYVGRSYRGRMYLPAIDPGGYVDGKLSTAYRSAIQTYFDDLLAAYGSGGTDAYWQWVVFSRHLGATIVGGHVTAYDLSKAWVVTSTLVRQILSTQRRREFGVGG